MTVWVFDVGQGDSIFIDAPDMQVLVDGGPGDVVLEKLSSVLPPWDRSIDVMIATHPHADHVEGLNAVREAYDVGTVYANGEVYDEPPAVAYALHDDVQALSAGQSIDLGNGARLDVVWPVALLEGTASSDPNDGSVVMMLTYGDTTMLLTGDVGIEEEGRLAASGLLHAVDVLKVGHHGSDTSTSVPFVNMLHPTYAVISVGESNDYGHPSSLVIDRLVRAGTAVLRTDVDGDVRITSTGADPEVARISL